MNTPPGPREPTNFNTPGMRLSQLRRYATNHLVTVLAVVSTVIVIAPLLAILGYLIYKGASSLNLAFFTRFPSRSARMAAVWPTPSWARP
jgi:phosphate transport system permease protein